MNMTKNEFMSRIQTLIKDYCRNNREYDDVDDYFDYCVSGRSFRISLEIESLGFDDDGQEE